MCKSIKLQCIYSYSFSASLFDILICTWTGEKAASVGSRNYYKYSLPEYLIEWVTRWQGTQPHLNIFYYLQREKNEKNTTCYTIHYTGALSNLSQNYRYEDTKGENTPISKFDFNSSNLLANNFILFLIFYQVLCVQLITNNYYI